MFRRLLANTLIAIGFALLLGTGTLLAYSTYEQYAAEREYAALDQADATPAPTSAKPASSGSKPTASSAAKPTTGRRSTPTATSGVKSIKTGPAKRLVIPAIDVTTRVVEASVKNGKWQVPKYAAGHLEGTAQPGQGRNVVMVGHVQSISAGNVFANLEDLEPGDKVLLYTADGEITYVVRALKKVKPNDLSVTAPGKEETLTLVTCTGTWNPVSGEYSHRLIAIAEAVSYTATR